MKKLTSFFIIMAIVGLSANCSDGNEISDTPFEVDESVEERNFLDSMSAQGVIYQMYDIQENGTYMFKRGRNINPSEPNKYYIACNNVKEAALFYNNYCTDEPLQVGYENVGDSLVTKFDAVERKSTFGNYGYTSLSLGEGNPIYATIELSLNAVGDTHELIFVPANYMPFNSDDKAWVSPYQLGDIYKDKDGNQWLCVQESQPAVDGYFVRLAAGDNVYWTRDFIKDHYKKVWYATAKSGYTIAGKDAWKAFVKMVPCRQGKYALAAMKKGGDVSMDITCELMKTINNENETWRIFQVGNVSVSGPNTHWWACTRDLYKIWVPYIVIHGKHGYYIGEAYAWHKLENENLKSESLKSGTELLQLSFQNNKFSEMTKVYPQQSGRTSN